MSRGFSGNGWAWFWPQRTDHWKVVGEDWRGTFRRNENSLCQSLLLQGEGWSRTRTKGEDNGPKGRTEKDGEGKMVSVAGSK